MRFSITTLQYQKEAITFATIMYYKDTWQKTIVS